MGEERRRSPRLRYALPVELELGAERRLAQSHDLSTIGLSLELVDPPPVGAVLRVVFQLPDRGTRIEAAGTVVWSRPQGPQPQLGLRFDRLLQGYVELGDFLVTHLDQRDD